jgi:2-C-methyl-D-erythritol 4-phosphate cytidylyltransferase/2-C-methyl-D-erythritol 2,4-cyclodiphosphate synthase
VINHLDTTLLCEKPRLGPHREAMRQRIAGICGLRVDQVSLKATTTEKLGFTGRREGIAAQAAATIRLPEVSA